MPSTSCPAPPRIYGTLLDNDQELSGSLTRAQTAADPNQASADALGGDYQLDVETWRLANKTTWQLAPDRHLDVGFSIEEQERFHPIVDRVLVDLDGRGPAPPVEVFSLLIDTDHRDVGAVVRYNQRIGRHDLLFGVNFGRNDVQGGNYRNLGGVHNDLTIVIDNDATSVEAFAGGSNSSSGRGWLRRIPCRVLAARHQLPRQSSKPAATKSASKPRTCLHLAADITAKLTASV